MEGSVIRLFWLYVVCIFLIISCSLESDHSTLSGWVSMEQSGSTQTRVSVRLEDATGNIPTGARVLLRSPIDAVSWLYFNTEANVYEKNMSGLISGDYTIQIQSVLGDQEISIPYLSLLSSPSILSVQDAAGVSVGNGDKIDSTIIISLSWNTVEGATVYQGKIINGANVVHMFSSRSGSSLLPPGTLEPGKTYSIRIEAQYIDGDPYYRDANYYAYSYSESPDYYFSTKM